MHHQSTPHPGGFVDVLSVSIGASPGCLKRSRMILPFAGIFQKVKNMLRISHAGSNLTTDAHIAALAADYGLIVFTNDTDFARFPGIQIANPLKG